MKIVFVSNEYDNQVSVPKRQAFQEMAKGMPDAEVHIVDFMQVRSVLPVSTAPCMFIQFDELEGDFDLENLQRIKGAVAALGLQKPLKGGTDGSAG